jgi:hypothetical protein
MMSSFLVGFDSEAQSAMINLALLFDSKQFRAPPLAAFTACKSKQDVLTLAGNPPGVVLVGEEDNEGKDNDDNDNDNDNDDDDDNDDDNDDDDDDDDDDDALNDFEDTFTRLVLVVPPFLANRWVDKDSRDPIELLLKAQAAISAFYTLHQGNPNMPTASTSTLHILQFLWAAIHKKLNGVPL